MPSLPDLCIAIGLAIFAAIIVEKLQARKRRRVRIRIEIDD
jgi:hypothetical protein